LPQTTSSLDDRICIETYKNGAPPSAASIANGAWGRALALRSFCDGHHKKALFIAELPKKNRCTRSGRNKQRPDALSGGDGRMQVLADRPLR